MPKSNSTKNTLFQKQIGRLWFFTCTGDEEIVQEAEEAEEAAEAAQLSENNEDQEIRR